MTSSSIEQRLKDAERRSKESRGISFMAQSLVASEILQIAYEVRDQIDAGKDILNLTVGDFRPSEFPIPDALRAETVRALEEGQTNYPPASGTLECRTAVRDLFERKLGLNYPLASVLIASGARPMLYGAYLATINPGDKVVYGVPSWNNNNYCTMLGAEAVELDTKARDLFFPTVEQIRAHLSTARLLVLNTPLNPTGTVMRESMLQEISEMIVSENRRRKETGQPALYLIFDQIYWMLTFEGRRHTTPVNLVPEMAEYTLFVDGISKSFAATGLRVGWAVGPLDLINRMAAILTHIGAWAPKPEQLATAKLLEQDDLIESHLQTMKNEVLRRLEVLNRAFESLKSEGYAVDTIAPQGAIYLSLHLDLLGKKTEDGRALNGDESIRKFVLEEAGIALIPFRCFGLQRDSGWFRASVGTLTMDECDTLAPRLKRALNRLT